MNTQTSHETWVRETHDVESQAADVLLVVHNVVNHVPDPSHRPLAGLRAGKVMAVIEVKGRIPLNLKHDSFSLLMNDKRTRNSISNNKYQKEKKRRSQTLVISASPSRKFVIFLMGKLAFLRSSNKR